ncbi:hypothetical protein L228DRAFT_236184 [Xylona heveae TC161]|uniref:Uncharacterized protein n=1 Tax=Xylona heveae (strain CBS 132557 / TC161) TaxID=1328760 RepID=A0A161TG22_XYLHT|nr:hypothetical protein L228DRAFT_236184 [Xylona heveae TC161]KZF25047.1 hypothetical protein L228DRAFT_236184 [Xylona heveae TC161]
MSNPNPGGAPGIEQPSPSRRGKDIQPPSRSSSLRFSAGSAGSPGKPKPLMPNSADTHEHVEDQTQIATSHAREPPIIDSETNADTSALDEFLHQSSQTAALKKKIHEEKQAIAEQLAARFSRTSLDNDASGPSTENKDVTKRVVDPEHAHHELPFSIEAEAADAASSLLALAHARPQTPEDTLHPDQDAVIRWSRPGAHHAERDDDLAINAENEDEDEFGPLSSTHAHTSPAARLLKRTESGRNRRDGRYFPSPIPRRHNPAPSTASSVYPPVFNRTEVAPIFAYLDHPSGNNLAGELSSANLQGLAVLAEDPDPIGSHETLGGPRDSDTSSSFHGTSGNLDPAYELQPSNPFIDAAPGLDPFQGSLQNTTSGNLFTAYRAAQAEGRVVGELTSETESQSPSDANSAHSSQIHHESQDLVNFPHAALAVQAFPAPDSDLEPFPAFEDEEPQPSLPPLNPVSPLIDPLQMHPVTPEDLEHLPASYWESIAREAQEDLDKEAAEKQEDEEIEPTTAEPGGAFKKSGNPGKKGLRKRVTFKEDELREYASRRNKKGNLFEELKVWVNRQIMKAKTRKSWTGLVSSKRARRNIAFNEF